MPHEILGNHFWHRSSTPAWTKRGVNAGDDAYADADTAFEDSGGLFTIRKRPIMVKLNGQNQKSGWNWLIRSAMVDDDIERIIGKPVSDDYTLITPQQAVKLYDKNVKWEGVTAPVETAGILRNGADIFVTTRLPNKIIVKRDEHDAYLLFHIPMEAGESIKIYVVLIRVVCMNTLQMAIAGAVERRSIPHTAEAPRVIASWLKGVYGKAMATTSTMQAAMEKLANTPVTAQQIRWVVNGVYPLPKKPAITDVSGKDLVDRMDDWQTRVERETKRQEAIVGLMDSGVGMDSPAVHGTAFGAWNIVSEYATHSGSGDFDRKRNSLIAGSRALQIRQAFVLASNVERYETVSVPMLLRGLEN
jgi:phage/plasmid-like protein (TIGR03299 family)